MSSPSTGIAQPIENASLQRPLGDARMVEIVFRCARHAEALHDAARALIAWNCKRHNLLQAQLAKAVIKRRSCGLGGVAPTQ